MPRPGAKKIAEAQELRALAHPVRLRLLTELLARVHGTASELAAVVGLPANSVSFHLRQLAKYGFLEEAPEHARDGRDRCWQLAYQDGVDYDELMTTPAGRAAVAAQHRRGGAYARDLVEAYFSGAIEGAPAWDRGAFNHDWYLRLTPEQASEFDHEYLDLCARWRDRMAAEIENEDPESASAKARDTFAVFIYGFPLPTGMRPAEATEPARSAGWSPG
jgi:DNA-binding transcriptional ArsR family regulator